MTDSLRDALIRCRDELAENLETEGRLSSFSEAVRIANAALAAPAGCVGREVAAAEVALMPFLRDDALLCDVRAVVTSMLAAPKVSDPAPAVTGEVGRYTHGRSNYRMTPAIDGPFVRYTDHARIVAAKDAFKAYVHRRLDAMGVPHTVPSPHTDAGCRIGGRLDWIEQRAEALADALDSIRQYGSDTLSGRVGGPDDRKWQRDAVLEMTRRANAALLTGQATPEGS